MVPSIYGENMFDDFFDGSFFGGHSPLFGKHARNLMKTDIRETDDAKAYRFAVELPGFEKDEIHVDVQDGYLTVSAEKGLDKDEENKKGRVLRQERYSVLRPGEHDAVRRRRREARGREGQVRVRRADRAYPEGGAEEAYLLQQDRHRVSQ